MHTLTLLLALAACTDDTTGDSGPTGPGTHLVDSGYLSYDSGACEVTSWWPDADDDGYGDASATPVQACESPGSGYVGNDRDCDDTSSTAYPGATDGCDDADNDCDGTVDEDSDGDFTLYPDADGDGWGDEGVTVQSCTETLLDHTDRPGDCDDSEAAVNPDESEVCNDGLDNDCDGSARPCGLSGTVDLDAADRVYKGGDDGVGFGTNGAGVGDLDGDGADDFVLASGSDGFWDSEDLGLPFYVAYGVAGATTPPELSRIGNSSGLNAAASAAGLDDLDGDGVRELLVGAPHQIFSSELGGAFVFHLPPKDGDAMTRDAIGIYGSGSDAGSTGIRVANPGDVDGDGVADAAIAAPFTVVDGLLINGMVAIFTGELRSTTETASAEVTIHGTHEEWLGIGLAGVGDTDGDGHDDLLLGSPGASVGGAGFAGEATLFLGPLTGAISNDDADVLMQGEQEGSYTGGHVSAAGDVDGDGYADVWVAGFGSEHAGDSQNGHVHLLLGPLDPVRGLGASEAVISGDKGSTLGWSLDGTGDMDGDGTPDLVVGAHEASNPAGTASDGAAYLFYGPLAGTLGQSDADFTVLPTRLDAGLGTLAVSAGDVNADGLDDLLLGAPSSDRGALDGGAVGVFWGQGL